VECAERAKLPEGSPNSGRHHDVNGANFPCYEKLAPTLYEESCGVALSDGDVGGAPPSSTPYLTR
jgi:hypothetical protein